MAKKNEGFADRAVKAVDNSIDKALEEMDRARQAAVTADLGKPTRPASAIYAGACEALRGLQKMMAQVSDEEAAAQEETLYEAAKAIVVSARDMVASLDASQV